MEANLRNTKLKIGKIFIENDFPENKKFSRTQISDILFVREKEFERFKEELFNEIDNEYTLDSTFFLEIAGWKKNHIESNDSIETSIAEYKEIYEKIAKDYNYNQYSTDLKPLINKLHWHFLPIYKDVMIDNRGISPEENIEEYYNHYHSLQDLYNIIDLPPNNWKTLNGDINLNLACKFPVYTNRWGHEDIYSVKRTYKGWYVSNLAISGESKPNGKGFSYGDEDEDDDSTGGGFIDNFNQDYVEYPKSFHYIIERLWEMADQTEMSINELQEKLLEVARLISEVEKTINRFTPKWY